MDVETGGQKELGVYRGGDTQDIAGILPPGYLLREWWPRNREAYGREREYVDVLTGNVFGRQSMVHGQYPPQPFDAFPGPILPLGQYLAPDKRTVDLFWDTPTRRLALTGHSIVEYEPGTWKLKREVPTRGYEFFGGNPEIGPFNLVVNESHGPESDHVDAISYGPDLRPYVSPIRGTPQFGIYEPGPVGVVVDGPSCYDLALKRRLWTRPGLTVWGHGVCWLGKDVVAFRIKKDFMFPDDIYLLDGRTGKTLWTAQLGKETRVIGISHTRVILACSSPARIEVWTSE